MLVTCSALLCTLFSHAELARADTFPAGYSVDVGYSGYSTSGELGGSGSLEGNGSFEAAEECAANSEAGPFSIGFYPPHDCEQVGRAYASPEHRFLFTGNENCVEAGRPDSGATFTWHVQLPHTGYWHAEIHVPNWTQYGEQDVYLSSSADGTSERVINDRAEFGRWVTAFGPHRYDEGSPYTVQLVPGHDFHCFYEPADQVRWVYDGPSSPSATIAGPQTGGSYPQDSLVHTSFSCTEAFSEPIESCTDSGGSSTGSGVLDTSTPGPHTYTVTARGTGGQTGTAEVSYTVLAAKALCTGSAGRIVLSPGLRAEPEIQNVKLKGTLSGCSGGGFTSAKFTATLRSDAATGCEALDGEAAPTSGTISIVWSPKAKERKSAGSFDLPLAEGAEAQLAGSLESGPFSPGTIYGTAAESFTEASSCGMPVKGKVKPVKKATFSGERFVVY
jgi:hypothetical protein